MKKTIRLTESDLNRIVRRTIMEMEETDGVDASSVIQDFMQSIADMKPEKQLDAIEEMMFQLKMYKTNLGFMGRGNPNAR